MRIPRPEKASLRKPTSWPWFLISDVGIACGAGVVGVATAYRYWNDKQPVVAFAVGVATALVLGFQVLKSVLQFSERRRATSIHDLAGCLQTLKGALEASGQAIDSKAGIRVTVYVPVDGHLEQVCDYICSDHSRCRNTAGRRMPQNVGVIGRAFQTGSYAIATKTDDNPDVYIADLVDHWNFSPERARKVDPTVRSWMAVPLKTPESPVEGVVYIDAQKRDFFTDNRQLLVLGCCLGIALFVQQRYN